MSNKYDIRNHLNWRQWNSTFKGTCHGSPADGSTSVSVTNPYKQAKHKQMTAVWACMHVKNKSLYVSYVTVIDIGGGAVYTCHKLLHKGLAFVAIPGEWITTTTLYWLWSATSQLSEAVWILRGDKWITVITVMHSEQQWLGVKGPQRAREPGQLAIKGLSMSVSTISLDPFMSVSYFSTNQLVW